MKKIILVTLSLCVMVFAGCSKKSSEKNIAVFVPGICDNSPVYAMLRDGVVQAVENYNAQCSDAEKVTCQVMEAGTNQAEWGPKITSLAASGKYDVIISSNPSLPELCLPVLQQFPSQKFILMDASLEGNPNFYTLCYNQYEQAYLTGFIGGLMSKSHKLGLIAAQEYPVMNNILYPYFEKGAKSANADSTVEFRIVGNWYDATKGAELADALIAGGVDVILPICGGAAQGVINSCVNAGAYVTWFDDNGFAKAPGTVISSSVMEQKKMTMEVTEKYLNNQIKWGRADMVGLKEGYIKFIEDDPLYISAVPEDVRTKMHSEIEKISFYGLEK